MRHLLCILCVLILSLESQAWSQTLEPLTLGYQGQLTDLAHQPISGERDLTFRLYNAQVGGEMI